MGRVSGLTETAQARLQRLRDLSAEISDWGDVLGDLWRLIEAGLTTVGDPIDVADGYQHGPVTDLSLGGLSPALEFSRTYDGHDAETANADPPQTTLGPGWRSSLDWRIEAFYAEPEGVLVRGADGGALLFHRLASGSYVGVGGVPFTFEQLAGGGYELTRLDKSGLRFDANGRLAAFFDRSSREMTVAYDANGHVTSLTDPASRTANVTTDAAGQITEIDLPDGRSVTYGYDASGRLVSVTDLAGKQIGYVLDIRGRISRIEDHTDTIVLRNLYDGTGRVIRQTDGEGNQTHLSFDPERGTTQAFDPLGNLTTYCVDRFARLYTSFDDHDGKQQIDYDSYGHPGVITDELGAATKLASDPLGRLTRITDPIGRVTTFDYNGSGDLVEVVDADGRTIDVAYNAGDLPSSVTVSEGSNSQQAVAYTYTGLDQVEAIIEVGGATTTLAYDADGYVASIIDAENGETTFDTDARGFVTSLVDPLGNVSGGTPSAHQWTFIYDAMGRMTGAVDPTGVGSTLTYDHLGRLKTLTEAGVTTTYAYDADGRLTSASAQGAGGPAAVTEYEYDAAGNLIAVVDAEDRRTEFAYDALGRLIGTTDADGKTWVTEYDAAGRVISSTDPTGREVTYAYDAAGQLISQTDAGADETTYEYDDAGRLTSVIDPLSQSTDYAYDWLGRLISVTDPLSNVTSFAYSSANDLVSLTNARNKTTAYEYDDAHRLTQLIDALLGETSYEYDAAGQLIGRQNARGHSETYAYDAAGRPTTVADPLGNSWQTGYDASGSVDHSIDAEGQQTDYAYDPLGRLITISPATGSDITFTYDLTSRRLSMADGNGTTNYEYDPIGRLTESTRAGRSVGYAYDGAGRLTSVNYPGAVGTVSLAYDAEGRLDEISDWDSRVTAFAYDALDRVTSITRPGDLVSSFAYDALGRVTSIDHDYDSTPVIELDYTYDAVGNVASRTDDQGTATFAYDDVDRLTAADYPGTDDYAYTYDAVGNLTGMTTPYGSISHTYDAADRVSDLGYVYDDNGALLTDGTRVLTYDALGRLTGVTGPSLAPGQVLGQLVRGTGPSLTTTYTLDGDGNRLAETVNGVTTNFDLDLRGLPTILVAGDQSYLPGMPSLGYETNGSWLNAMTDAQGSVLQTIDAAGVTGALMRYDPYGGPRPGSSATAGIGYTGEWADPTGMVNLRFRAYDPWLGRFVSRDNFAGVRTMPLTGNRHSYAIGNPLIHVDRSGHFISAVMGMAGLQEEESPEPVPTVPIVPDPEFDPYAYADDFFTSLLGGIQSAYTVYAGQIWAAGLAEAELIRTSPNLTTTRIPILSDLYNWGQTKLAEGRAWIVQSRAGLLSGGTRLLGNTIGAVGIGITSYVGFQDQWNADTDRAFESRLVRATSRAVITGGLSGIVGLKAGAACGAASFVSGPGAIAFAAGCGAAGAAAGAFVGNIATDVVLAGADVISNAADWLFGW